MSVVVIARMKADAARLAKVQEARADEFRAIAEEAKKVGALSHRFVFSGDEVLVLDEWTTGEAFQKFFDNPTIASFMQDAGVEGPPQVEIFETMETVDQF